MTVAKHYPSHLNSRPLKKEPSWFLLIIISGIISGILLFAVGWYLSLPSSERDTVFKKILSASDIFPGISVFNHSKVMLVMGVDMPPRGSKEDYKAVRTDTMMLVKMDTRNKKVNIVSIPRDSKVFIPGDHGINKINAAFTFGGADLAVQTVEQTFGVDVDNFMVVNIRGVREVVDAVDGIDLYVEKSMHYRDRTAKLNIALEPGQHHLDGKEAEGFLRFRHDALGDIGRIRRQQQFISAFSAKLKDPAILLKLKPLIDASSSFIQTDMSPQDIVRIALFAKDLERSDFQVATLPGHPSMYSAVSYWVIDPQPAEDVLNRMIVGVEPAEGASAADEGPSVGILYTANHADEVSDFKSQLEAKGFRVVCRSAVRRSGTKLVTHTAGQPKKTEAILQHSSPVLKDAQLIFSPHGTTFESNSCGRSDYTVILGDDTRSAVNQ